MTPSKRMAISMTCIALAAWLAATQAAGQGWAATAGMGAQAPAANGEPAAKARPPHAPVVPSTNTDIGADMNDPNILVKEGSGGGTGGARALLLNTLRDDVVSGPAAAGGDVSGGRKRAETPPAGAR